MDSASIYGALHTLSRELSRAFSSRLRFHTFSTDASLVFRFQLYCLLAATYAGSLEAKDWDVEFYLKHCTLPNVKRALADILAA